MTELSTKDRKEAAAIGQAISDLCAGHRMDLTLMGHASSIACALIATSESPKHAETFVDALCRDIKDQVRRDWGKIEVLSPALDRKHTA